MRCFGKHIAIVGGLTVLLQVAPVRAQPRVSGSPAEAAARPGPRAAARPGPRAAARPGPRDATPSPSGPATGAPDAALAEAPARGRALTMRSSSSGAGRTGGLTLQQAIALARKQNLDLKVSDLTVRSAKVGRKLGWALLGPHFSLGVDLAFLGGDSQFDTLGSSGSMDFSDPVAMQQYVDRICSSAQDSAACLGWMMQNAEYTGLILGDAFSSFGAIGDIFNADTVKFQLGFAWQILDWNNLINVKRFKLSHQMAKLSYKSTAQDVVTNVKVMFYAILAAQEAVKIVRETSGATKEHLRQARALMAAGLGTRVDVLRWQAKIADDEQKLLEARQQVSAAKMRLNNLLGRPLRSPLTLVPPAEVASDSLPPPGSAGAPLGSHPSLRLTKLNVQMSRIDEQKAKAAFLPTVSLAGGYTWQNYMPYDEFASKTWLGTWAVMLSVKVPIFDSMTKIYNVRLKQLEVAKARMRYRNVQRLLKEAVLQADLSVIKSYKSIEVARKQVKLAAEAHKSAENLYKAGNAKTTDVLDAQNGLRMARFNLLSARFGYLTALARREKAVGAVR